MAAYADPRPEERGYEGAPPTAHGHLPPGGSKWLTPSFLQTISFFNSVSRTFGFFHDEALRDSICNSGVMLTDAVITTALNDRWRPVAQLEWHLEERNPTNPLEKRAAEIVTEVLEDIPDFQQLRRSLLWAIWYGRSAVQLVYGWDYTAGDKRLVVRDWSPVNGNSLVFKFDGTVGWLVHPGLLRSEEVVNVQTIEGVGGAAKFLTPDEDQAVLVHKFEPEAASYFSPELAGSVKGSGYQGRIYWYWWLKHNLQHILFNFVRRAGNGHMVAGYQAGQRDSLNALEEALEPQSGNANIYVPLDAQTTNLDNVVKHIPVSMTGAEFQWQIVMGLNGLIRDAILGQSMANKAAPAGIGGSNADHMGQTDDERVKYDATDLETPLQKLVNVLYRAMFPHIRPAKFVHLADKRNPLEVMQASQFFMSAGGVVPQPWAQQQLGIPNLKPGETGLGQVQSTNPTALNSVPAGVPMAGQPGPEAQGAGSAPAAGVDPNLAAQIKPE